MALRVNARGRRRTHRRRFRRNPLGSVKGIGKQAVQGLKDASGVLLGEAGTNIVSNLVPVAKTGITGFAVRLGSALVVGFGAHKALGADFARFVVAGGFAAVLRPTIKQLNLPLISSNLGGIGAYPLAGLADGEAYLAATQSGGPDQLTPALGGYADMGYGDGMDAYPMQ